jgi:hypothetical protein
MISTLAAAMTTVALTMSPVHGIVAGHYCASTTPVGPLRLPIGPECWTLRIDTGAFLTTSICVTKDEYYRYGVFSQYP